MALRNPQSGILVNFISLNIEYRLTILEYRSKIENLKLLFINRYSSFNNLFNAGIITTSKAGGFLS